MNVWAVVFSALASFAGAWLASKWALNGFYKQKVWERKLAAYTAIFDALHDMNKWFEKHLDEEVTKVEIPPDELEELRKSYKVAQSDLQRRMDSDGWLLSTTCRNRVLDLRESLRSSNFRGWGELVDFGTGETRDAIRDLHSLARKDLELDGASGINRSFAKYFGSPSL
jgi:hypothetical protein